MKAYIGNGWYVEHITDRVCELKKDDYAYRRITGSDGFVRVRSDQDVSRYDLIQAAIERARRSDFELALRIGYDIIPTANGVGRYRNTLHGLHKKFATPEDPEIIGVKRP